MQEVIQWCETCNGIVPIWEKFKKYFGKGDGSFQQVTDWAVPYIEGAVWCDCLEVDSLDKFSKSQ